MAEREEAEMKLVCAFFAALTALLGSHDGFAQSAYPDKAIRILVGFPPGGPPDIAARLLADKFAEAWGKPVLVDGRACRNGPARRLHAGDGQFRHYHQSEPV